MCVTLAALVWRPAPAPLNSIFGYGALQRVCVWLSGAAQRPPIQVLAGPDLAWLPRSDEIGHCPAPHTSSVARAHSVYVCGAPRCQTDSVVTRRASREADRRGVMSDPAMCSLLARMLSSGITDRPPRSSFGGGESASR